MRFAKTGKKKWMKTGLTAFMAALALYAVPSAALTVKAATTSVKINATNFPDATFRKYVSDNFDTNGNGTLSVSEINAIEEIYCYDCTSLKGIEYFTSLKVLSCESFSDIKLKSLDVSKNTALKELNCFGNSLGSLNVTKNTALVSLSCGKNSLTTLNLTKNTALTELNCEGNSLSELNLSKNTSLIYLSCGGNSFSTVDLHKNTELQTLDISGRSLTSLDLSKNTKLRILTIWENNLASLDLSKNTKLTSVTCIDGRLEAINLTGCTALNYLTLSNNSLSNLDLSTNKKLDSLVCDNNRLSSLDLRYQTNLTSLDCSNNRLSRLNIRKCTLLSDLIINDNQDDYGNILTNVDLTNCPNLVDAYVNGERWDIDDEGTKYSYTSGLGMIICSRNTKLIPELKVGPVKLTIDTGDSAVYLKWDAIEEAYSYCVYRREEGQSAFTVLGNTKNLKYTDKTAEPGKFYYYSVRCRDDIGSFIGKYDTTGKRAIILAKLTTTLKVSAGKIKVTWSGLDTAAKYRLFRKVDDGSWTKVTTQTALSYTDTNVTYGKTYSYGVVAMNAAGSYLSVSDMDQVGKTVTYIMPAPAVILSNERDGIRINWAAMTGAAKYRVFRRTGSTEWVKVETVQGGTTCLDTECVDGKKYYYTVLGMDSSSHFMNDYDNGNIITRVEPKVEFSLYSGKTGVKVTWSGYSGAGKYRIYRKKSGEWVSLGTVKADETFYFADKTVVSGKSYTYTVVAMTSGGTPLTKPGTGQKITYIQPVGDDDFLEGGYVEILEENIIREETMDDTGEGEEATEDTEKTEDAEEAVSDTEEAEDTETEDAETAEDIEKAEDAEDDTEKADEADRTADDTGKAEEGVEDTSEGEDISDDTLEGDDTEVITGDAVAGENGAADPGEIKEADDVTEETAEVSGDETGTGDTEEITDISGNGADGESENAV